jgi:hypothetical protein
MLQESALNVERLFSSFFVLYLFFDSLDVLFNFVSTIHG